MLVTLLILAFFTERIETKLRNNKRKKVIIKEEKQKKKDEKKKKRTKLKEENCKK